MAEDEARRISERTKVALAAAKARGKKLGSARDGHWTGREDQRGWKPATKAAAIARTKAANDAYAFLLPTIQEMRGHGASYQSIVNRLNQGGHSTSAGKPWTATAAFRLILRSSQSGASTD